MERTFVMRLKDKGSGEKGGSRGTRKWRKMDAFALRPSLRLSFAVSFNRRITCSPQSFPELEARGVTSKLIFGKVKKWRKWRRRPEKEQRTSDCRP
jgi:hypothetical protein